MTAEWRRWIAENVLLRRDPGTIAQAMIREGFSAETARRRGAGRARDPYIVAARQLGTAGVENLEPKLKKRDWVLEIYRRAGRQATNFGSVPASPSSPATSSWTTTTP